MQGVFSFIRNTLKFVIPFVFNMLFSVRCTQKQSCTWAWKYYNFQGNSLPGVPLHTILATPLCQEIFILTCVIISHNQGAQVSLEALSYILIASSLQVNTCESYSKRKMLIYGCIPSETQKWLAARKVFWNESMIVFKCTYVFNKLASQYIFKGLVQRFCVIPPQICWMVTLSATTFPSQYYSASTNLNPTLPTCPQRLHRVTPDPLEKLNECLFKLCRTFHRVSPGLQAVNASSLKLRNSVSQTSHDDVMGLCHNRTAIQVGTCLSCKCGMIISFAKMR